MRSRRALLYMPGSDDHKIKKALELGVDSICMDLEDGVAINRKEHARQAIAHALANYEFKNSEKAVRINPIGSTFALFDLEAILPYRPDAIVLPKVRYPSEIRKTCAIITEHEKKLGLPIGEMRLLIIIETPQAIINLREIAQADSRIDALIFGAEDLIGEIGGIRTQMANEVLFARSAVVVAAVAYQLQAIDMVYLNFKDPDGLALECQSGVELGYSGKQIIHPNQVTIVQKAFTPSDDQIAQAEKLINEYNTYIKSGIGAYAQDGKLIDAPVIKAAQNILNKARAAGKII